MAKFDFYNIDKEEKIAIFSEIATQYGMKPFAVEKDWWVSRTLEIIFQMPIAEHLVFKGGTSLSKAWKLINRFSEDIDLTIDKEFFGVLFKGYHQMAQFVKCRKSLPVGSNILAIIQNNFSQLIDLPGISNSSCKESTLIQPSTQHLICVE